MLFEQLGQRAIIRLLIAAIVLLVLVSGIAIGLAVRGFTANAAPVADVSACVSRFTGAVRMNPTGGSTACTPNETQVVWPATRGATDYEIRGSVYNVPAGESTTRTLTCEPGEVAVGGGAAVAGDGMILTSDIPVNSNNTVEGVPTARNFGARNTDQVNFGALFTAIICASTTP